jgi:hypothetical protein
MQFMQAGITVNDATLLFNDSAIFSLVRELRDEAPDKLADDSTIPVVFYELGNAIIQLFRKRLESSVIGSNV